MTGRTRREGGISEGIDDRVVREFGGCHPFGTSCIGSISVLSVVSVSMSYDV